MTPLESGFFETDLAMFAVSRCPGGPAAVLEEWVGRGQAALANATFRSLRST